MPPFLFHALLFAPSLVMVALQQSSMAAGLAMYLVCLCAYLAANCFFADRKNGAMSPTCFSAIIFVALLALLTAHSAWPIINNINFQISRFLGSYAVLALMFAGALGFTHNLTTTPATRISRWVEHSLWFLVLNALLGLSGLKLFPQTTYKPIGLFSEPSHLALILAPLLAYMCAIEARGHRLLLAFFFAWGIAIENLTTIVAVILCFLITFRFNASRILLVLAAAASLFLIDLEYFISRAVISGDSDNISVLVLLQGWETALLMLERTGAWGAGFQQFGFSNVTGEISDKITTFGEENLNQFDGGSTAAKIIGEFGGFGVLGLMVFVVLISRAYLRLRSARKNGDSGGGLLLAASLYTFVIELFARGVGYFSPTCFLALCALMSVACFRNKAESDR